MGGVYGIGYTGLASFVVVAAMSMVLAGRSATSAGAPSNGTADASRRSPTLATALEENAGLHAQLLTPRR